MRLEVSRRADLAVRVLALLASTDGRMKASELAGRLATTPGFVPHVLNPLVARGWVRSDPGPTGGYSSVARPADLSVLDVIEAVEGPTDTGWCVLAERRCGRKDHCALHDAWSSARTRLLEVLSEISVAELTAGGRS